MSMHPVAMICLRLVCTSFGWQPAVPQEMWAMRKSPGFMNRMNSGDSLLSSVYDRTGLAAVGQNCGIFGCTCALFLSPHDASPPWQSVQPMRRVSLPCGSPTPLWQPMHPTDLA